MKIQVKRVYLPPAATDGLRVLVDRLWPRGLRKSDARIDAWPRDLAPSDPLRKWFGHEPDKWPEFRRRYFEELAGRTDALARLLALGEGRTLTLLFGAKEERYNNAVALKEFIEMRMKPQAAAH